MLLLVFLIVHTKTCYVEQLLPSDGIIRQYKQEIVQQQYSPSLSDWLPRLDSWFFLPTLWKWTCHAQKVIWSSSEQTPIRLICQVMLIASSRRLFNAKHLLGRRFTMIDALFFLWFPCLCPLYHNAFITNIKSFHLVHILLSHQFEDHCYVLSGTWYTCFRLVLCRPEIMDNHHAIHQWSDAHRRDAEFCL